MGTKKVAFLEQGRDHIASIKLDGSSGLLTSP